MSKEVYVLSESMGGIPLNPYFKVFPQWTSSSLYPLNLKIVLVSIAEVKRAFSYRHLTQYSWSSDTDRKYLTQDAIDLLTFYKQQGHSLDGLWIDVLCLSPGGHDMTAFDHYVGRMYSKSVVIPFWLVQENTEESFNRAWIYQESRFQVLDMDVIQSYVTSKHVNLTMPLGRIIYKLHRQRGFTILHDQQYDMNRDPEPESDQSKWLKLLKEHNPGYTGDLKALFSQFLTSGVTYESDVVKAIFGVITSRLAGANLSSLPALSVLASYPNERLKTEDLPFPVINRLQLIFPEAATASSYIIFVYASYSPEKPEYGEPLAIYVPNNQHVGIGWLAKDYLARIPGEVLTNLVSPINLRVYYKFCSNINEVFQIIQS